MVEPHRLHRPRGRTYRPPDTLSDPFELINPAEGLHIDLTRIGESNPTIYGPSRTVPGSFALPRQWIWYVQTGASGANKLVYIDALTGQSAAVCWSAKGFVNFRACPVYR